MYFKGKYTSKRYNKTIKQFLNLISQLIFLSCTVNTSNQQTKSILKINRNVKYKINIFKYTKMTCTQYYVVINIQSFIFRDLLFKTKYFSKYYITPHIRVAPYILGLTFGYIIFYTKNLKLKVNPWLNAFLWVISFIFMSSAMFGSHIFFLDSHEYNRLESSLYLTFSRTGWTMGLVWIIWSCINGQGGL